MSAIDIHPGEKRDIHVKVYVEQSVLDAIKMYQVKHGLYSVSETARYLMIHALENEGKI